MLVYRVELLWCVQAAAALFRRAFAGLYSVRFCLLVLAWARPSVSMHPPGAHRHSKQLLQRLSELVASMI